MVVLLLDVVAAENAEFSIFTVLSISFSLVHLFVNLYVGLVDVTVQVAQLSQSVPKALACTRSR